MLMLSGVLGSILSKLHIYYFGYFNRKEFINTEEALAVKKITCYNGFCDKTLLGSTVCFR